MKNVKPGHEVPIVCIDAGHYGKRNRSPVVPEYYESEMNWKLQNYQKEELEKYGIKVITTYKTTIQGSPFKEYGSDGNISVITLPANVISTGVAYIRLCCGYLGEDSIITANEPIE